MLKQRAKAFYIVVIAVVLGYFVYSANARGTAAPFRLGLDLSGGAHSSIRPTFPSSKVAILLAP